MTYHHGMARRRTLSGFYADAIQVFDQPVSGVIARRLERRISRNRGNSEQIQQTVGCGVYVGINAVEYIVEGHD